MTALIIMKICHAPSCICWALGRCFTLHDNIGQNHSSIPYYHGHFPTHLTTQNITAGSPSLQETNVQNRAVPTSRNSVGFPPFTPVQNSLVTDGSRAHGVAIIGGHTQDSIDQYYYSHHNCATGDII